ncbi:MAG: hypothetical protein R3B84_04880 [Zavarzinella sp.]
MFLLNTSGMDVTSVCFSPDATSLYLGMKSGEVQRWCMGEKTGYSLFTNPVTALACHPEGKYLVAGAMNSSFHTWTFHEPNSHWRIWTRPNANPSSNPWLGFVTLSTALVGLMHHSEGHVNQNAFEFVPLGNTTSKYELNFTNFIVSGSTNWRNQSVLWSDGSNKIHFRNLQHQETKNHQFQSQVRAVDIHPHEPRVASTMGWEIAINSLSNFSLPTIDCRHSGAVSCLKYHPGGEFLMSGSWDGTIRLWDDLQFRELRKYHFRIGKIRMLAISNDGSQACAVGQENICLFDLE